MPQICKQALERPICMLLGEELGNCTVPFGGSPLFYSLVIYCSENWTVSDPQWPWAPQRLLHHASATKVVWSGGMTSPLESLLVCMMSVFAPTHFWPSLKHLFSRCCFWQALHDIKSEILTENQTASRPLAVTIHRPFFAVQICVFPFFLSWSRNSLWHGTNYFITIHFVFHLFFFCPWPWGHGSSVQALESVYHRHSSTYYKLHSSCLSI